MSLKAGNYKGFVYATGEKIVSIESAVTTLKSDVVDASGVVVAFKEEFQDLSGQVQVLDASWAVVEGRLDGMDASMAAVEVRVEDLSGSIASLSPTVYTKGGSTVFMLLTNTSYTDDQFILELPAGVYSYYANLQFSLSGSGTWNDATKNGNLINLQFSMNVSGNNTGGSAWVGDLASRDDTASAIYTSVSGRFELVEPTFVKPYFFAQGGASPGAITINAVANNVSFIKH